MVSFFRVVNHRERPHAQSNTYLAFLALQHQPASTNLGIAEIHLGMLLHEFLQQILLLLLVTARFPLALHFLVVHHFLDHSSGLTVQFRQLGIFGLDLGHVNLGRRRHDVRPPVRAARFRQVDVDGFCGVGVRREDPCRVVHEDRVGEVALLLRGMSVYSAGS